MKWCSLHRLMLVLILGLVMFHSDFLSLRKSNSYGKELKESVAIVFNQLDHHAIYSSYLGGSRYDEANLITIGPNGHLYIAGFTYSVDFYADSTTYRSVNPQWCNIFLIKWDPDLNEPFYSALIGGSSIDRPTAIFVDSKDQVYLAGYTWSKDFPVSPGAFNEKHSGGKDAFILKLNSSGTKIVYSSLLGGSDDDYPADLIVDSQGNAYLTGSTRSPDFPISSGAFQRNLQGESDLFFIKMNPRGSHLLHASYIGGSDADEAVAMAQSADGTIYLAGTTFSSDFFRLYRSGNEKILNSGTSFVIKILPNRYEVLPCFFMSGSQLDKAVSLLVDDEGIICLGGTTFSSDFPADVILKSSEEEYPGIYLAQWDPISKKILSSMVITGNHRDYLKAMTYDHESIILAGLTYSSNLINIAHAAQGDNHGQGDGFIIRWNCKAKKLVFATYWGGSAFDDIQGVALSDSYELWTIGSTSSPDFPLSHDAKQRQNKGQKSAFLSQIVPYPKPELPLLEYPEQYQEDIFVQPLFIWKNTSQDLAYKLFLYDAFQLPVFESDIISKDYFQLPFLLDFNQWYYWRVQSICSKGLVSWSSFRSFLTENKKNHLNLVAFLNKNVYVRGETMYLRVCIYNSGNVTQKGLSLSMEHPEIIHVDEVTLQAIPDLLANEWYSFQITATLSDNLAEFSEFELDLALLAQEYGPLHVTVKAYLKNE